MLDDLKARLDRLLRDAARPDRRAEARALHDALLEAKVAVRALRDALAESERALAAERRQLADAERRGRLAAEVPDPETVAVAERFAARHRERVTLLERKLTVQRDELVIAERELDELAARFRAARTAPGPTPASPDPDPTDPDTLAAEADQKLRDRAVDAQLAYLKKKLGKD